MPVPSSTLEINLAPSWILIIGAWAAFLILPWVLKAAETVEAVLALFKIVPYISTVVP